MNVVLFNEFGTPKINKERLCQSQQCKGEVRHHYRYGVYNVNSPQLATGILNPKRLSLFHFMWTIRIPVLVSEVWPPVLYSYGPEVTDFPD